MKRGWRAYLDLVRLPNVITAAADSLAGFLLVGGSWGQALDAGVLMTASCLLYAGGVALNDVCDVAADRSSGRRRPIVDGAISPRRALIVAVCLLALGTASAAFVGVASFVVACAIAVCVVLYDAVLKRTPAAPAMMGACRAANLLLGMTVATAGLQPADLWPCALMWLYVTSLTFLARKEALETGRARAVAGVLGCVAASVGVIAMASLPDGPRLDATVLPVLLASAVLLRGLPAACNPNPTNVQRAVKTFVVLLPLLNGAMVATQVGLVPGLLVAAIILPAVGLSRFFAVT